MTLGSKGIAVGTESWGPPAARTSARPDHETGFGALKWLPDDDDAGFVGLGGSGDAMPVWWPNDGPGTWIDGIAHGFLLTPLR